MHVIVALHRFVHHEEGEQYRTGLEEDGLEHI